MYPQRNIFLCIWFSQSRIDLYIYGVKVPVLWVYVPMLLLLYGTWVVYGAKESYVCQASYTSKTVNKRLTVKNVILNLQEQTACKIMTCGYISRLN